MFDNSFGKCGQIFKILLPVYSYHNSVATHLICNMLLYYLLKFENLKMLSNFHLELDN